MPTLEANQLLAAAVDASDSKKAEDIRILALDPSESALTDYFLICSGSNERQNAAIADEIEGRLKRDFGTYPNSVEGRRQGEWILMDYVDFVVHIFMPEKRAYYGLERLRKSAKSISVDDLNQEISRAIQATRAKHPVAEEGGAADGPEMAKAGGKPRRRSTNKVTEALAPLTVEKKAAAKKAARKVVAKKAAAKRAVIPQPAARGKSGKAAGAKKSAAKKSAARKSVKTKSA